MIEFKIGNRSIGSKYPTFIIAEMSANHGGNIDDAIELVHAAKRAGADAIKLQTYTADTITINSNKKDFLISKSSPWKNYKNLWNLYNAAHTPWSWHEKIFNESRKLKMEVFSSPFDETAVDFLEKLNVNAYKVASPEITNIPLIEKIAKTGKPIIISSGLSNFNDIDYAIKIIRNFNINEICVLKCTTSYPAPPEEANLLTIPDISSQFNVLSGLSDHTLGYSAPIASVVLGASIIEKHIKLDNSNSTPDSFFSLNEFDFKKMVDEIKFTEKALGKISYDITKSAQPSLKNRSSIYCSNKISKGEIFTRKNLKVVRPGLGLHPKFFKKIIGKISKHNLEKGDALSWDNIDD